MERRSNGYITKGHKKTLGNDKNVCYLIIVVMASHMSKLFKLDTENKYKF